MHIALATATAHRAADTDLPLLVDAASRRGHQVDIFDWNDPSVDWNGFDRVVVRSTWDYTDRRDEFLAWTRSIPALQNPADVIAWNTDKTYLREFAADAPVIETHWNVTAGDDIGDHAEWVCKPSVSAGSRDTARWGSRDEVYAHSAALIAAGRTSMVQPYIQSVDSDGETAMIFIAGMFSHAIRKGQLLHAGEGVRDDRHADAEHITPRAPTAAQHEIAAESLAAVERLLGLTEPLLYARIDLVGAEDGSPMVIEVELTEPSLFLTHSTNGAERLIRALER